MDNYTLKALASISNRIPSEQEWADDIADRQQNAKAALEAIRVKPKPVPQPAPKPQPVSYASHFISEDNDKVPPKLPAKSEIEEKLEKSIWFDRLYPELNDPIKYEAVTSPANAGQKPI